MKAVDNVAKSLPMPVVDLANHVVTAVDVASNVAEAVA